MKKKLIVLLTLVCVATTSFVGCGETAGATLGGTTASEGEEQVPLEFDAMFYDNHGNNYVTFRGNNFNITPNKVKQWGYNTDGSWTSWYETSSVMTISIDGYPVESCGSTILFKDTRLEIEPLNENIGILQTSSDDEGIQVPSDYSVLDWVSLRTWWLNYKEKGQGVDVIIVIQSQNGDNIGVVSGSNIVWEVAEKLPKTTLITVDNDKKLYLHRCNFTIIDARLFEKMVVE